MASPLFAILESINQTLESGSPGEIRTPAKRILHAFLSIKLGG